MPELKLQFATGGCENQQRSSAAYQNPTKIKKDQDGKDKVNSSSTPSSVAVPQKLNGEARLSSSSVVEDFLQ